LPLDVVREHQIVVIPRGGCSFSVKLRNIPAYAPHGSSLQLVVVVSYPEYEVDVVAEESPSIRDPRRQMKREVSPLVQPLLDELQYTPSGLPRPHPLPLVMVGGGDETMALLRRAKGVGVRRRWFFLSQGVKIGNLIVL